MLPYIIYVGHKSERKQSEDWILTKTNRYEQKTKNQFGGVDIDCCSHIWSVILVTPWRDPSRYMDETECNRHLSFTWYACFYYRIHVLCTLYNNALWFGGLIMNDYNFVMNLLEQHYRKKIINDDKATEITESICMQYPDLDTDDVADAVFDYFPN